jgi:menaquinone-specific isochorismate synthase
VIREGQGTSVTNTWGERLTLVSYAQEAPGITLENALAVAQGEARVYWKSDLHPAAYAGFGAAALLTAEGSSRVARIQLQIDHLFEGASLEGRVPRQAAPRLFGGFAFTSHYQPLGIWSAFPSAGFVLPRVQFTELAGKTWITVSRNVENVAAQDEILGSLRHEAESILAAAVQSEPRPQRTAAIAAVRYPLVLDDWRQMVAEATGRIRRGDLDKVVLSRICDVEMTAPLDPARIIDTLGSRYPDCYRFLLEIEPGHAFLGATPELLVEVHDSNLHTMALAGSRKRGATAAEDDRLAQEMMDSPKERHEHALVVEAVRERVKPYARTLDVPDEPSIFRLQNIQHLCTPVRAELETHFDVLDLVGELHPTPALGGSPRRAALEAIAQLEREERGWYAAPVGWVDAQGDGMFAVAIRSAVCAGKQARLYAGAGIVVESDPDKEWDETRLKFSPLLQVLGVSA